MTMDGEEVLSEADILCIDRVEITFAKREVVDGVEEVGLAGTVVANKAIDVVAELHVGLGVILEIGQYQSFQRHNS